MVKTIKTTAPAPSTAGLGWRRWCCGTASWNPWERQNQTPGMFCSDPRGCRVVEIDGMFRAAPVGIFPVEEEINRWKDAPLFDPRHPSVRPRDHGQQEASRGAPKKSKRSTPVRRPSSVSKVASSDSSNLPPTKTKQPKATKIIHQAATQSILFSQCQGGITIASASIRRDVYGTFQILESTTCDCFRFIVVTFRPFQRHTRRVVQGPIQTPKWIAQ